MSKVNVEIEVPDRIRGTDIEKKLLAKLRDHALEQAVVELYKEGEISSGTGAELLGMPLYDDPVAGPTSGFCIQSNFGRART